MSGPRAAGRERDNRRMGLRLTVVALGMFAFGFLMVPFYDHICRALGINNLSASNAAEVTNTQVDAARTVSIEFDANTHDLPWKFRPLTAHMDVHPGALTTIEYEVSNTRARPVTGQAVPSFGPQRAGLYFKKIECFCFSQQTLAAGEVRRMPVVFMVDPSLPKDVNTITLSYTFFEVPGRDAKG